MEPNHNDRLPAFQQEIPDQIYEYNNLSYSIVVMPNHEVMWTVSTHLGDTMATERIQAGEMPAMSAVHGAHDAAREWIDDYVLAHRALQEAMEEASKLYAPVTPLSLLDDNLPWQGLPGEPTARVCNYCGRLPDTGER